VLSSLDLVRRVAAFGLPGNVRDAIETELDETAFAEFLEDIRRQRLAGFLMAIIEAGGLPVTAEQRVRASQMHLETCAALLRLERRLLEVADVLEAGGIDFLVLKGAATAHLVYPDPAVRVFGDNDLLFRSDDFDEALEVLYDHGYVRPAAPPRPGFDRRFGKGATLARLGTDELDAHRNLLFGTFGFRIDLDELFASAVSFHLGGRRLKALGPETRLMHACYHAALGDPDPRFGSVRDVAQMLATGDHDNHRVLALARQWEARAVLARAFSLCREHLGVEVESPLADALSDYEPSRRERRAIASYVGKNRHYAAKVIASLPYLDSYRDKAAFLRASAAPSDPFVESRGGEPGFAWILRGLRALLPGGIR
jgi:hypothetical protein